MNSFQVSVKTLAEFSARSGDLGRIEISKIRAIEGLRAHQRYQQAQPDGYRYEVKVEAEIARDEIGLKLSGRVDGLRSEGGRILLDELKSTRRPPAEILEAKPVHLAQAKIYAAMFHAEESWVTAEVRVIYLPLDRSDPVVLSEEWEADNLLAWFDEQVGLYLDWLAQLVAWQQTRNSSVVSMSFPFSGLRSGQSDMMESVGEAIDGQRRLYVQAPTGIGKTMSTIFPAVQRLPQPEIEKLFFLTAKNSGKRAAEQALSVLGADGVRLKSVTITAKQQVCCKTGTPCDQSACPYALGFYDRLRGAIDDAFAQDAWTREVIGELAEKHQVCPFEFSLDLANLADVVICDYNYLFDGRVQLQRFFAEGEGPYVFLVDEAHNLPGRARDMFSAALRVGELVRIRADLGAVFPLVRRLLQTVLRSIEALGEGMKKQKPGEGHRLFEAVPEDVLEEVQRLARAVERVLSDDPVTPVHGLLFELYFYLGNFLLTAERVDDRYAIFYEVTGRERTLKLLCLDPAKEVLQATEKGQATIFFSATLEPMDYYKAHFGGDELDPVIRLGSPFPSENFSVKVCDHIATTWRLRDRSYEPIAEVIRRFVEGQGGTIWYFSHRLPT